MSLGVHDLASSLSPLVELASAHISLVSLAAARLIPIVWLAPTFGGRLLPVPARLSLALGLALVLAPPSPETAPPVGLTLIAALFVETLIGITLGLLASLPFELARAGGHLVDVGRGASLAQVIAPGLGDRATPTGDLLYLALLVALTAAGGDRLLVLALAEGFMTLPAGAALSMDATSGMSHGLIDATTSLISTAFLLATPPLMVALLADVVLGVVGRVVPQLPLFFLGMPVKTVLGLLLVAFALGPMLGSLFEAGSMMPDAILELSVWLEGGER